MALVGPFNRSRPRMQEPEVTGEKVSNEPGVQPSPLLRARHRLRTVMAERPNLYLPVIRYKYRGPSPMVIGDGTEAVIDGYTRSASTFVVYAFQLSQPTPVRLAHHLHAPAQLIEAARRELPTLVLLREPKGAVLSQLVREPWVDMRDALFGYARFHKSLLPYRSSFVIGEYAEVTRNLGVSIRRMNERFGTSYAEFTHREEALREVSGLVRQRPTLSPTLLGFESGLVSRDDVRAFLASVSLPDHVSTGDDDWVPSERRDKQKAVLHTRWESDEMADLRNAAVDAYEAFRTGSSSPPR
jgi:hypothetical protein